MTEGKHTFFFLIGRWLESEKVLTKCTVLLMQEH